MSEQDPKNQENAQNKEIPEEAETPEKVTRKPLSGYHKKYLLLVLIVSVVFLLIALLQHNRWDGTALLYVGIPILLSIMVAAGGRANTMTAEALRVLTVCLLLSAIVLREGVVCIVIAAPILYTVTAVSASLVKKLIDWRKSKINKMLCSPFACLLILMSLEGTHPALTFERSKTQSEQKIIAASVSDIQKVLAQPIPFTAQWHWSTALFPKPINTTGQGLAFGDTRTVDYVYYKHIFFNAHRGSTVYRVREVGPNSITFDVPQDTSYLATYLRWHYMKVSFKAIDENHTEVTWTLSYERKLDPAWYFSPLQHYFVGKTAQYMLDNLEALMTSI